ncbi:MAG: indole-3-glycerol-phosphate synthase [Desulfonatronovibrio sp.]
MKENMLQKFIKAKQEEISLLTRQRTRNNFPQPYQGARPGLMAALSKAGPAVIAEYKKASPSRGAINLAMSAEEAGRIFQEAGAAACSVLTEKVYFQGDINYIESFARLGLPVLRKDFLFHPLQIKETAATRASALLLIVRVVQEQNLLTDLVKRSFEYGIEPVVEIFNAQELEMVRKSGARVILVNNRDLDRMVVDLDISRKLAAGKKDGEIWICASGIDQRSQVREFYALGFDAFLIGTSIMSADDPQAKLREMTI